MSIKGDIVSNLNIDIFFKGDVVSVVIFIFWGGCKDGGCRVHSVYSISEGGCNDGERRVVMGGCNVDPLRRCNVGGCNVLISKPLVYDYSLMLLSSEVKMLADIAVSFVLNGPSFFRFNRWLTDASLQSI